MIGKVVGDTIVLQGKRGPDGQLVVELGSESQQFRLRLEVYPSDEDVMFYQAYAGTNALNGSLGFWVEDAQVPWERSGVS